MLRLAGVFAAMLSLSFLALGQAAEKENWCRAGFFTTESNDFRIGTVAGKPKTRIYFYNDFEDDCPRKETCRAKAYLVSGNRVIVSRSHRGFGCAWYAPLKGSPTIGWIKLESLQLSNPKASPRLSDWIGEWQFADNSIRFTDNKLAGYLNVTGDALWRGFGDNVHIGELDDRAQPAGNLLKIGETETDEYACKVSMRLIGEFLVAEDNMRCGGANVSFSGVYRRTRR